MDDFALTKGRRYATVIIDALTHRRVEVLPDRLAERYQGPNPTGAEAGQRRWRRPGAGSDLDEIMPGQDVQMHN